MKTPFPSEVPCPVCLTNAHLVQIEVTVAGSRQEVRRECACGCTWVDPPRVRPVDFSAPLPNGGEYYNGPPGDHLKASVTLEVLHKILDERDASLRKQFKGAIGGFVNLGSRI